MAYALPELSTGLTPAVDPSRVPARSLRRPSATMLALTLLSGLPLGAAVAVKPIAGVFVVVAVAVALVLVERPQAAVYLMVAVAPACAGLKRGLVVPGLRVSEVTVAGLATLVIVFAPRIRAPSWTRVEIMLLLYAAATAILGGVDLAMRHAPLNGTELGTLLGPVQFVLLLRAVIVALPQELERVKAAHFMLGAAAIVGLISLLQFGNIGPTRSILESITGSELFEGGLAEGVGRVTGPFNIWHELAGFLMPSILLSTAFLLNANSTRARLRYGAVVAITGAALMSTVTIGPLIATALGVIYLCWKRGVLHVFLTALVPIALIAVIAFGGSLSGRASQQYSVSSNSYRIPLVPQSISYRYAIFREQSAPALAGRWLSGYGPDLPIQLTLGNFPYTETAYITLLLRGGVPLLGIFVLLLLVVGRASRRAQRIAQSDFEWSVATVVLIMTVSYLVLQFIESYLLDSGPPHAYWAVVGLMLAASTGAGRHRSQDAQC